MTLFDQMFDFNHDGYADTVETTMGCMILDELESAEDSPDSSAPDDFLWEGF